MLQNIDFGKVRYNKSLIIQTNKIAVAVYRFRNDVK